MSSPPLDALPFIDIYVRLDEPDQAYYRSRERGKGTISQFVPPEYQLTVDRFMNAVNHALGDLHDGAIDFEGVRCRLSRQILSDQSVWVCARRITTVIPKLEELGYAPHYYQHMQTLGIRDGLILISGATGSGKTTAAVALLAHFLRTYGGTAVTIEDPVEYMLKGRHGEGGQCFQVEVKNDEDWAVCVKRSLRWAPRYIYVGEVRTPKAAEQLLRAATTGHLVITTVHAGAIEEALMGMVFLAEQAMGPGAQNMLSAGLSALLWQKLGEQGPSLKYLYTEPDSPGDPIRSLIRENKVGQLSTYVDRIAARLAQGQGQGTQQTFKPATVSAPQAGVATKPPAQGTPSQPIKKA